MQLFLSERLRYFVYRAGCDMRKGYDGLSGIVRNEYKMDPLSGDVFVFFSRGLNKIKVLHFQGNGGSGVISVVGYLGAVPQDLGRWETSIEILQYTLIDIPLAPVVQYDSIGIYLMAIGLRDSLGFNPGYVKLIVDEIAKETISGIDELKANQRVGITPNPFNEYTELSLENPTGENCSLTIYDSQGKLVQTIKNITIGKIKIERKNLADGIYFFKIQSESNYFGVGKFIVQ